MSAIAIRVEGLGKMYRIGAAQERYVALRDVLSSQVRRIGRRIFRRHASVAPAFSDFWALRDVSFDVPRGECVGIIGRNGAGKSTLLKVLSRITEPTTGGFRCRGRIASLLEVGTGFHPELTGRENIYLNGAILGMQRAEIRRKFDEIVAFSEVEKFLDTPVKYYSSGMYTRLAFSVAAHLEPEILVVDEVLAVGDAEFQRKCLGKMESVAHSGRTVLFVSHNVGAVLTLCRSGLLLKAGRLVAQGAIADVFSAYSADMRAAALRHDDHRPAAHDAKLKIRSAWLETDQGPTAEIDQREPARVVVEYEVLRPGVGYHVAVEVHHAGHGVLFTTSSYDSDPPQLLRVRREPGRYRATFPLPSDMMRSGEYWLRVGAAVPCLETLDVFDHDVRFTLHETTSPSAQSGEGRRGAITPTLNWTMQPA